MIEPTSTEQEATRRLRAMLNDPNRRLVAPDIEPPPDLEQMLRERQEALRALVPYDGTAIFWRLLAAFIPAAVLAAIFFVIGVVFGKYLL